MKSKELIRLLNISRPTMTKYVKNGTLKVTKLPNGQYDYDEKTAYSLLLKGVERKTYIYSRVSTSKQKPDLKNQTELLKQFCFARGYKVDGVFEDVASGISFEKRSDFFTLMEDVMDDKVERVVITYKDRISRVGFDLFSFIFKKYNTEIVVMSSLGDPKIDSKEIFEEIVSLLHCYSMKMYSSRKNKAIKEVIEEEK